MNLEIQLLAELAPWQQTLLTWLGYDFSDSAGGRPELIWTNRPDSWGVFVLIAVVAAVIYAVFAIYRRELDTCPRSVKVALAFLRAGVVLLLACIFLGPALVYLQNRTIQPTIVVARDASLSMETRDAYVDQAAAQVAADVTGQTVDAVRAAKPTRTQIINEVLSSPRASVLQQLGERGKIQVLDFSDQVTRIEIRQPQPAVDGKTKGSKTENEKSEVSMPICSW